METEYKALKKREILTYIENYRKWSGNSPTLEQIAKKVKVAQGSLSVYYMKELVADGWLRHTPNTARSLVPMRDASEYPVPGEVDNVGA